MQVCSKRPRLWMWLWIWRVLLNWRSLRCGCCKRVPSSAQLAFSQVHDSYLKVGATLPLSNLIGALLSNQDKSPSSFEHLASHLKKVWESALMCIPVWLTASSSPPPPPPPPLPQIANVPVRNVMLPSSSSSPSSPPFHCSPCLSTPPLRLAPGQGISCWPMTTTTSHLMCSLSWLQQMPLSQWVSWHCPYN